MVYRFQGLNNDQDEIVIGSFAYNTILAQTKKSIYIGCKTPGHEPVYVVDDKVVANLKNVEQSAIRTIYVLSDTMATNRYGNKAIYGAVVIQTNNRKSY